jgi:hypothetical protein
MVSSCFIEAYDEFVKKYPEDKFLYEMIHYKGCPAFNKRA